MKLALLPAALAGRERRPGLYVLIYHRVGAGMAAEMDLPAAAFARHLDLLRDGFDVVRLRDGLARLQEGALVRDAVAVTFDDGYADVYRRAWPMLRDREIPSTLFLATGFLDGTIGPPLSPGVAAPGAEALAWEHVAAMIATGLVDVGSHTVTHPDFDAIDAVAAERELADSRAVIRERLGIKTDLFAYPRAIVGHETLVANHYRWALGGEGPKNLAGSLDPIRVQRTPVRRSDGVFFLKRRLAGAAPLEDRLYARLRGRRP
ncbi:MAG: polysaccharide deacetylase family protein [Actinobacteria bacterium]|nr:polysaccharide deacetylase family protein [Actinomycetota bacterium]